MVSSLFDPAVGSAATVARGCCEGRARNGLAQPDLHDYEPLPTGRTGPPPDRAANDSVYKLKRGRSPATASQPGSPKMNMSQLQYFPLALPHFSLLVVIFLVLVVWIEVRAIGPASA